MFIHQAKDPELFKRITEYWNPSYNGSGTCRPKKEYVFNVLHRNMDVDEGRSFNWCLEKKHTKLIKMGARAFKALKVVRDNCGEFDSYDVVFSKQGTGSDTFYSIMKGDVGTKYNKIGPLDDDEKGYEAYDLDHICRLASANYILTNLRNTIERIDAVMGTQFVAELEKQKQVEDELYAKSKGESGDQPVEENAPAQKEASSRVPIQPTGGPAPVSRVPASTATIECGFCHEQIPEGATVCPKCQQVLMSDCDVCHKPISVFATKCPFCSTDYTIK